MSVRCFRCEEVEPTVECESCSAGEGWAPYPLCETCSADIHKGRLKKSHRITPLSDQLQKHQVRLTTALSLKRENLERKLQELQYTGREIREGADHCERLVEEAFFDLQCKLQKKARLVISTIKQTKEEKLSQKAECMKVITDELEELGKVSQTVEEVLNTNDIDVLYEKIPPLIEKLESKTDLTAIADKYPSCVFAVKLDISQIRTCIDNLQLEKMAASDRAEEVFEELKIGDSFHAVMEGRMNEKGEFWVVKNFDEYPEVLEELEMMKFQIRKDAFFTSVKIGWKESITEGALCFGLFDQDCSWFRAVVEKVNFEKDVAQLRWLDYGLVSDVSLENVMEMTEEYKHLPFQAVRCCLYEELDGDMPRDARWEFADRTLGRPIICKVKKQLSGEAVSSWLVDVEISDPNQNDIMTIMEEKIQQAKDKQDTLLSRDYRLTLNPEAFSVKSSDTSTVTTAVEETGSRRLQENESKERVKSEAENEPVKPSAPIDGVSLEGSAVQKVDEALTLNAKADENGSIGLTGQKMMANGTTPASVDEIPEVISLMEDHGVTDAGCKEATCIQFEEWSCRKITPREVERDGQMSHEVMGQNGFSDSVILVKEIQTDVPVDQEGGDEGEEGGFLTEESFNDDIRDNACREPRPEKSQGNGVAVEVKLGNEADDSVIPVEPNNLDQEVNTVDESIGHTAGDEVCHAAGNEDVLMAEIKERAPDDVNLACQIVSKIVREAATTQAICPPNADSEDAAVLEEVVTGGEIIEVRVEESGNSDIAVKITVDAETVDQSPSQDVGHMGKVHVSASSKPQKFEHDNVESENAKTSTPSQAATETEYIRVLGNRDEQLSSNTNLETHAVKEKAFEVSSDFKVPLQPSREDSSRDFEVMQTGARETQPPGATLESDNLEEQNAAVSVGEQRSQQKYASPSKAQTMPFIPQMGDVSQRMMEENYMIPNEPRMRQPVMPSRIPVSPSQYEPVVVMDAYVGSELTSAGMLWIRKIRSNEEENQFQIMSMNLMRDIPKQPHCVIHYYKMVAAYSENAKMWFRARVEKHDEKKVLVRCIDYGHSLWVQSSDIRDLPLEYQTLKPQANECSLKSFPNQEFSDRAKHVFKTLTSDKILVAISPLRRWSVQESTRYLWLKDPTTNIWVNEELFKIDYFDHLGSIDHVPLQPPSNCIAVGSFFDGSSTIHPNPPSHQIFSPSLHQPAKSHAAYQHPEASRYYPEKHHSDLYPSPASPHQSHQGPPQSHHATIPPRPTQATNTLPGMSCFSLPSKFSMAVPGAAGNAHPMRAARSVENIVTAESEELLPNEPPFKEESTENPGAVVMVKKEADQPPLQESVFSFDDDAWVEGRNPITDSPLSPETNRKQQRHDQLGDDLSSSDKFGGSSHSMDSGLDMRRACYSCGQLGHKRADCMNVPKKGKVRQQSRRTHRPRHK